MPVAAIGAIMDMVEKSEELRRRVKERAALFCDDNYRFITPQDLLIIENAMLIGALIVGELEMEELANGTD
jgi:hypothetical protein